MNLRTANLVLAIAAVVLAVPTWLTIQGEGAAFVDVAQVPHLFEGFTADLVANIALGEPKPEQPAPAATAGPNQTSPIQYDLVTFQRVNQQFVLGQGMGELAGAPVNRELVDLQVLKHLAEIRSDQRALVQPEASDEQLAEYGLDPAHAFVVKASDAAGQVLAELLVGKDTAPAKGGADDVRGVFVRRRNSRDVVLYEVPYWPRGTKPEQWLDRTVLRLTPDVVRRLTIRNESGTVTFARPKGRASWDCEQPPEGRAAVRQIEVEGLVQRFTTGGYVLASEFLRPLQTATLNAWGLDPPRLEVHITYDTSDTEQTVVLGIGAVVEGKSEFYLRSSDSAFAMTIAAYLVSPFERAVGEYFDPKAPAPGPDDPPRTDPPKDEKKGDK